MTDLTRDNITAMLEAATPGPWYEGSHDPERGVWIGGRNKPGGMAVGPYLYFGHTINWPENYRANARLIAAAPDLARLALDLMAENERLRAEIVAMRGNMALANPLPADLVRAIEGETE